MEFLAAVGPFISIVGIAVALYGLLELNRGYASDAVRKMGLGAALVVTGAVGPATLFSWFERVLVAMLGVFGASVPVEDEPAPDATVAPHRARRPTTSRGPLSRPTRRSRSSPTA